MCVYQAYGDVSKTVAMLLLVIMGTVVNAPYSLITTAVSADLGTHPTLSESARAMATVSAIIDGTGSIGSHEIMVEKCLGCQDKVYQHSVITVFLISFIASVHYTTLLVNVNS